MWRRVVRVACAALICVLIGGALWLPAYLDRAHGSLLAAAPPPTPRSAVLVAPNGRGLAGSRGHPVWLGRSQARFRLTLTGDAIRRTVVPEIELLPARLPFSGMPNSAGAPVSVPAGGSARVELVAGGLLEGRRYHWRARVRDENGVAGPWIDAGVFGISAVSPPRPRLLAASGVQGAPLGRATNAASITLQWTRPTDRAGIAYYQWAVSRDPRALPTWHRIDGRRLRLRVLPDGDWRVSIRAMDRAGNVSPALHWSVRIDRRPPTIADLRGSSALLTPQGARLTLHFSLARPALVTVSAFRAGSLAAPAYTALGTLSAGDHAIEWRGVDGRGTLLGSGQYRLVLQARDSVGNTARATLGGITIDTRRIVVSLSKQDLTVYDGSSVLLHTLITSGGPDTQTPVGTFHILAMYAPYVMRSPWPKSSPLWYPDSPVHVALLFREGGYFLHDAPWRTQYGPGSNSVQGTPGGNTTGTHGCVNVPYAPAEWLYAWARIGVTVEILP